MARRLLGLLAAALLLLACGSEGETSNEPGEESTDPTLAVFDLGAQSSQAPFSIEIGESALGFTVYGQFPLHAGFETVSAPNGELVVQESGIPGTAAMFRAFPTFSVVPAPYDVLATVPQSDAPAAMPLTPGVWQVQLRDQIGLAVEVPNVRVLIRHTSDGKFHGGTIDVNVFLTPNSADAQEFRETVEQAFSNFAGISVGDIRFYPMDQTAAIVDDEEEFRSILRGLAAVVDNTAALNVVVVQDMSKIFTAAKSGGTPGLTQYHGTYVSGLVMETSHDIGLDALMLGHEAGHLAGLFHTTEKLNPLTDPQTDALSDTDSCSDPVLLDQCPDAANLMFPLPSDSWSAQLSEKQRTVIQASTFYRFVDTPSTEPQTHSGYDATIVAEPLVRFDKRWHHTVHALSPSMRAALMQFCGSGSYALPSLVPSPREQSLLFAMGVGPDVPDYVRKRALMLASRRVLTVEQRHWLRAVALEAPTHPAARIGALHALRQAAPVTAESIARTLLSSARDARVLRAAQSLIDGG